MQLTWKCRPNIFITVQLDSIVGNGFADIFIFVIFRFIFINKFSIGYFYTIFFLIDYETMKVICYDIDYNYKFLFHEIWYSWEENRIFLFVYIFFSNFSNLIYNFSESQTFNYIWLRSLIINRTAPFPVTILIKIK